MSAKAAPTGLAVVLDPEYGERLYELVEQMPAWALDSTVNHDAAERLYAQYPEMMKRLRLFELPQLPVGTEEFVRILATIELHRQRHSEAPFQHLEVIGMELYPDLNGALLEFGFKQIERTPAGFRASGLSDRAPEAGQQPASH